MRTINVKYAPSIVGITSQYLPKYGLVYIILIIYLEINLLEKFNLNLSYILIRVPDFDNQDNTLYKASY